MPSIGSPKPPEKDKTTPQTLYQKWKALVGPYYCPHCIREELVPVKRLRWFEFLWMVVLVRPWRCPHCFNRFLRGII